jgi:hypothetical protein
MCVHRTCLWKISTHLKITLLFKFFTPTFIDHCTICINCFTFVFFTLKLQYGQFYSSYSPIGGLYVLWIHNLWQYGLWSFQMGGAKLERFLPKNQHTLRKLLNFKNWISGASEVFKNQSFKSQLFSSSQ